MSFGIILFPYPVTVDQNCCGREFLNCQPEVTQHSMSRRHARWARSADEITRPSETQGDHRLFPGVGVSQVANPVVPGFHDGILGMQNFTDGTPGVALESFLIHGLNDRADTVPSFTQATFRRGGYND